MDVDVLNLDADLHLSGNESRVDGHEEGRDQARLLGPVVGVEICEDVARRAFGHEASFFEQLSAGRILRTLVRTPLSARQPQIARASTSARGQDAIARGDEGERCKNVFHI